MGSAEARPVEGVKLDQRTASSHDPRQLRVLFFKTRFIFKRGAWPPPSSSLCSWSPMSSFSIFDGGKTWGRLWRPEPFKGGEERPGIIVGGFFLFKEGLFSSGVQVPGKVSY